MGADIVTVSTDTQFVHLAWQKSEKELANVKYTMAADRGNVRVGALADAVHPAVLRSIRMTVGAADAHGRWVGVCGELAGDPDATMLLLGLGVRELSMGAPAIALVKREVRATDITIARAVAEDALACATSSEVRDVLRRARNR